MEPQKNCLVETMSSSQPMTLSVQLPGDLRLGLTELKVRDVHYAHGSEIRITVEIDFSLQQESKRRNNGTFKGELVGQFELPPLLPGNKPAPNSFISTVADTATNPPCDKCSETSSTPLLAPTQLRRPKTPPRARIDTRPSSAVPHRRSVSQSPPSVLRATAARATSLAHLPTLRAAHCIVG